MTEETFSYFNDVPYLKEGDVVICVESRIPHYQVGREYTIRYNSFGFDIEDSTTSGGRNGRGGKFMLVKGKKGSNRKLTKFAKWRCGCV